MRYRSSKKIETEPNLVKCSISMLFKKKLFSTAYDLIRYFRYAFNIKYCFAALKNVCISYIASFNYFYNITHLKSLALIRVKV